jgi:hypothetical protein
MQVSQPTASQPLAPLFRSSEPFTTASIPRDNYSAWLTTDLINVREIFPNPIFHITQLILNAACHINMSSLKAVYAHGDLSR